MSIRHEWKLEDVIALYEQPLLELVWQAAGVHRLHHDPQAIQRSTLLSVKTGGCSENCGYCPQSAHHDGPARKSQGMLSLQEVQDAAQRAKDSGASRFCMGAAWREVKDGAQFDSVIEMVEAVSSLGLEACVTLGMVTSAQAQRLKAAGLTAYNHNLDTSSEHYGAIISTRTYEDRLQTLANVQQAGLQACCGGILGMGETPRDRCMLLQSLANLDPQPESVPLNVLVRVPGTPLAHAADFDPLDLVRAVAVARLIMPKSRVRLSAGRNELSREAQALCFLAGANSIFFGDQLLTTVNPQVEADERLLRDLGLRAV
jgi:biotin synthase